MRIGVLDTVLDLILRDMARKCQHLESIKDDSCAGADRGVDNNSQPKAKLLSYFNC